MSRAVRRTMLLGATLGALLALTGGTALASHPGGLDIALSPANATKPVYSEHTVTADVSNDLAGPAAAATVVFAVSGPDGTFEFKTSADESGGATLAFDNSGLAGTYTISATAEWTVSTQTLRGESPTPVTVAFTDGTRPTVVENGLVPQKGQTRVARGTNVMSTFSEVMKQETLSASTFKLYQWNQKKGAWKRVPADPAYSVVDCTEFETTCLAMPRPACEMWQEGEHLRSTCEVPALDPYPSDPTRLLGARRQYKAVVATGAQDINGEALAKGYAWKFTSGRS